MYVYVDKVSAYTAIIRLLRVYMTHLRQVNAYSLNWHVCT